MAEISASSSLGTNIESLSHSCTWNLNAFSLALEMTGAELTRIRSKMSLPIADTDFLCGLHESFFQSFQ